MGQWVNISDTTAIILKCSSSGQYLGNITWGGSDSDAAYGIAIDSNDNIYITGTTQSFTIGGNFDIFLAKFNSSGNLEWNKTLPGSNQNDFGRDLTIDPLNNIYLVGYNDTTGSLIYDIFLAKYDSEGVQKWNTTWGIVPFSEEACSISIDSQKNIFVTGYQQIGADYNIKLIMFNNSGDYQWNETWDGGFNPDLDEGWGVEVDSNDFIYVVGHSTLSTPQLNATILKYNTSGNLQWSMSWGGSDDDYGRDIVIDPLTDNIYITGITTSFSASSDDDLFILKLIEYPPGPFKLDSDAETPDEGGVFKLNWTESSRANNYTVYEYFDYITKINGSVRALIEETTTTHLYICHHYTSGTYYYIIRAHNNIGETLSNCIKIDVEFPQEGDGDEDGNGDEDGEGDGGGIIPGYNLYMTLILCISVSAIIVQIRRKKS